MSQMALLYAICPVNMPFHESNIPPITKVDTSSVRKVTNNQVTDEYSAIIEELNFICSKIKAPSFGGGSKKGHKIGLCAMIRTDPQLDE